MSLSPHDDDPIIVEVPYGQGADFRVLPGKLSKQARNTLYRDAYLGGWFKQGQPTTVVLRSLPDDRMASNVKVYTENGYLIGLYDEVDNDPISKWNSETLPFETQFRSSESKQLDHVVADPRFSVVQRVRRIVELENASARNRTILIAATAIVIVTASRLELDEGPTHVHVDSLVVYVARSLTVRPGSLSAWRDETPVCF